MELRNPAICGRRRATAHPVYPRRRGADLATVLHYIASMAADPTRIENISAVTLYTTDMARAVRFYEALGMARCYGDNTAPFSSFRAGSGYMNIALGQPPERPWGRAILYVADVDAMYARVLAAGYTTITTPADAVWGERYFHVRDPDGNELSFARPLVPVAAA